MVAFVTEFPYVQREENEKGEKRECQQKKRRHDLVYGKGGWYNTFMPRRGFFHDTVCTALIADGWVITADPLKIPFGGTDVYIDLAAEEPAVAAEKEDRKIAVEIKVFRGISDINDLEDALGQFVLYRSLLKKDDASRVLYLGIPLGAYVRFLRQADVRELLADLQVKLIVIGEKERVIDQWIES